MRSRSMTMWIDACENGSQTRAIFTRHPKRELHEVYYARSVATIRDRVVQTAAMLVLEPIFEADLQPEQHAYRAGVSA